MGRDDPVLPRGIFCSLTVVKESGAWDHPATGLVVLLRLISSSLSIYICKTELWSERGRERSTIDWLLPQRPQQPKLGQAKARTFFQVFYRNAGPKHFGHPLLPFAALL